jgi:hypothetical protein
VDAEFLPEARHLLHGDEDGEGDDEEIDDGLEEESVADDGLSESELKGGNIDTLEDDADEWRDDIGDKGSHDLAESGADHDTDREIDDIATEREFFEILEHRSKFLISNFQFLNNS